MPLDVGHQLSFYEIHISTTGMPLVSGGLSSAQAVFGARGRWSIGERWDVNVRGDAGLGSGDSSW
jgi:hypothetical protein